MVGELIMLPVRVGVRATQLWLRAAEETVSVAADATGRLVGLATGRSSRGSGAATAPRPDTEHGPQAEPAQAPGPPSGSGREDDPAARAAAAVAAPEPASPPKPPPAPPEAEPVHVSEEPTLVEAFAEPGAEDGAGAQVHIGEPWEGYGRMGAKEIISRLGGSTSAELAAVQLYESTQRSRQTILNAVQRELRSTNGRSQ